MNLWTATGQAKIKARGQYSHLNWTIKNITLVNEEIDN
jgi:hypothetical protein